MCNSGAEARKCDHFIAKGLVKDLLSSPLEVLGWLPSNDIIEEDIEDAVSIDDPPDDRYDSVLEEAVEARWMLRMNGTCGGGGGGWVIILE